MSRSPAIALSLRLALVSALALPVLVPLPARGQGDDMERAREAYSRGQTLFDAGDHAGALTAFVESLDAFPHFRTIFNIALCHEKLGDVAAAVAMYERYVEWPSDVPNREEVRAKAAELRALLPSEPEPEPAPAPPPGGSAPPPPPAPPPVTAEPGRDLRVPGWVAVGGGAAGLVVGGVLLGMAQQRASEIEDIEGVPYEPSDHDALQREGSAFEIAGWTAVGAGAAIVASGVVMLLLSEHERGGTGRSEGLAVGLAGPAAGGLAIGVGGRF